ncbi:MAG: hypothetical protein VW757_11575, partial [Halieaceae bacterium]
GSEGMFTALLDAVFNQINPAPSAAGTLRSDAPPSASEEPTVTEEPPRAIPVTSFLMLIATAMVILLTAWMRLRRDQLST